MRNRWNAGVAGLTTKFVAQTIVISIAFYILLYVFSLASSPSGSPALKPDPIIALVALTPFIVWLIITGRITGFKAGGLEVSFLKAADNTIIPDPAPDLSIDEARIVEKKSIPELDEEVSGASPNTLSFELGKKEYYRRGAITRYLDSLQRLPHFNNIVFTDSLKRLKGSMTARDFSVWHHTPGSDTVGDIETGRILANPRVIQNSIKDNSTNKDALKAMERAGTDTLPVVNADGKLVGFVSKDKIIRNMLATAITE